MSKKADTPAVDLDRMTVQQLTVLIAAAEAKRRDKLEDARDDKWPRKRHLSVSHGDISSGEAKGFQNYMGYKTTTDSNSAPPAFTVSTAHTNITKRNNSNSAPPAPTVITANSNTTRDRVLSFIKLIVFMVLLVLLMVFAGGR